MFSGHTENTDQIAHSWIMLRLPFTFKLSVSTFVRVLLVKHVVLSTAPPFELVCSVFRASPSEFPSLIWIITRVKVNSRADYMMLLTATSLWFPVGCSCEPPTSSSSLSLPYWSRPKQMKALYACFSNELDPSANIWQTMANEAILGYINFQQVLFHSTMYFKFKPNGNKKEYKRHELTKLLRQWFWRQGVLDLPTLDCSRYITNLLSLFVIVNPYLYPN